ncbi:MAG: 1-acyl-sn-glycerol-3-phosphate acyltransferase [Pseudomonadales bacterium]|nr:1-acyl-sn-glycerol-3-phosphate acyltransferase [Pseudomonadales bacterium]
MLATAFTFLRSVLFHLTVLIFTLCYTVISIAFVKFIPYQSRFRYLTIWSKSLVFLARFICGIRYKVTGLENIPEEGSYVVMAKHQSQWETFFLVNLLQPISIVCKQELLKLPLGVGYGISLLNPITINRSNPRQALKQIQATGIERLQEDNMPVLIFPEGTRTAVGKTGKYARSAAQLAIKAEKPAIFISLNSGLCWPDKGWLKYPGLIEIRINTPVTTAGKTAKQLTDEAQTWIEGNIPAA